MFFRFRPMKLKKLVSETLNQQINNKDTNTLWVLLEICLNSLRSETHSINSWPSRQALAALWAIDQTFVYVYDCFVSVFTKYDVPVLTVSITDSDCCSLQTEVGHDAGSSQFRCSENLVLPRWKSPKLFFTLSRLTIFSVYSKLCKS